jgi:hypothetical protein
MLDTDCEVVQSLELLIGGWADVSLAEDEGTGVSWAFRGV